MTRTLTGLGLVPVDQRCECVGACGREHRKTGDGRCQVTDHPAHPLTLTAPGESAAAIARLPRERLRVLCHACATGADRAASRARVEHAHAEEAAGPDLLDLLASDAISQCGELAIRQPQSSSRSAA